MRSLVILALLALAPPIRTQDGHSDSARAALVTGVNAFKARHYDEAAHDFQAAIDAEPTWDIPHLYLGTTLSYQVVPNLDTPENRVIANRALVQFNQVLASDPNNLSALRQVASIQRNVNRPDEALAAYRKVIAIAPNDADAHYNIGVLEWTDAYKFTVQTLAKESLQDDGNGNARMSVATCAALVAHNTLLVNEGTDELTRAVNLNPTYNDAMSYLNLMYRRRADLDCTNPSLREKDLETANEWTRRSTEARRLKTVHPMPPPADSTKK